MCLIILFSILGCQQPETELELVSTEKEPSDDSSNKEELSSELQVNGLSFVLLDAATFLMGSPEEEAGRSEHEVQHQVTLTSAYYISTTEVTRGQFLSYMSTDEESEAICLDEACPVHFITWHEAVDFANHLSREKELQECYLCEGEGKYRPVLRRW